MNASDLVVVGGGPAGMMAGLLFARAGVRTIVVEKHGDFLRDFRGDTVHPSTLELMRELGLGSADDISLKEARERASLFRKLARDGIDPIAARDAERLARAAEAARAMTFRQCAEAYIEAHRAGWRNAKHAAQWPSTLVTYVYPSLGDRDTRSIGTADVLADLSPLWNAKPETASRVRQRIET